MFLVSMDPNVEQKVDFRVSQKVCIDWAIHSFI